MPVIRTGYGYGLWGLGASSGTGRPTIGLPGKGIPGSVMPHPGAPPGGVIVGGGGGGYMPPRAGIPPRYIPLPTRPIKVLPDGSVVTSDGGGVVSSGGKIGISEPTIGGRIRGYSPAGPQYRAIMGMAGMGDLDDVGFGELAEVGGGVGAADLTPTKEQGLVRAAPFERPVEGPGGTNPLSPSTRPPCTKENPCSGMSYAGGPAKAVCTADHPCVGIEPMPMPMPKGGVVVPSGSGSSSPAVLPSGSGFVDGLLIWTKPNQWGATFSNIFSIFGSDPGKAVGFLSIPALAAFFFFGGGLAHFGYQRRRGRVGNPRRRRNPSGGSYFIDSADGKEIGMPQKMPKAYALAMARRAADSYGKAMKLYTYGRDGKQKLVATIKPGGPGSRKRNPRRRRRVANPRRRQAVARRRNPTRKAVNDYEVVVGNIGRVYSGKNGFTANNTYQTYVGQSKRGRGRAAGEQVVLFKNGQIVKEHYGS